MDGGASADWILLISDDEGLHREVAGHVQADVALHGCGATDALTFLGTWRPSVIVVDARTGEGRGLLADVRSLRGQEETPILAVVAPDAPFEAVVAGGADDFIVTPLSAGELGARLRLRLRALGRRG